jgi:hypothetical protein
LIRGAAVPARCRAMLRIPPLQDPYLRTRCRRLLLGGRVELDTTSARSGSFQDSDQQPWRLFEPQVGNLCKDLGLRAS